MFAQDDAGNVGSSTVQVQTTRPIAVEIDLDDLTLSSPDQLQVDVNWDLGVRNVRFELDGIEIASWSAESTTACSSGCEGRCSRYSQSWTTSALAEGSYPLTAIFEDESGRIVEDTVTVRVDHDRDGDGYASAGFGGTDCDDLDASVHPGATEICDNIDNDCDGDTDEGFDLDGDGYPGHASCPDEDWVDCDEDDPAVNPGATEICGDGIDNNCNGADVECRDTGTYDVEDFAFAAFNGESTYDYIGSVMAGLGDVDGDGFNDLLIGSYSADPDAASSGFRGGVYIVSGQAEAGEHDLADAMASIFSSSTQDGFGWTATSMGDLNGDGYDDFVVGEPFSGSGVAHLFYGPAFGTLSSSDADAQYSWSGNYAGYTTVAGDLNHDGRTDLILGACVDVATRALAIFHGPLASSDSSPDRTLTTSSAVGAGCRTSMGSDIDGDGFLDLLVAGPGDSTGATKGGTVWVLTESPSSSGSLTDYAEAAISGVSASAQAGWGLASVPDTNGDGYGDVLIGAPYYDGEDGRAWLVEGPVTGPFNLALADTVFVGGSSTFTGLAVAAFDYDGDGLSDLAIGSPAYGRTYGGAISIFYGPSPSGSVEVDEADLFIEGDSASPYLGLNLASVPDLNADGSEELLAASDGSSPATSGRTYLILGSRAD